MANRNANDAINNSANEFLSLADLEAQMAQEAWDEDVKRRKEALKIEYSLIGQYKKKQHEIDLKLIDLKLKKESAKSVKEQEKLQKEIDKLRKKQTDNENKEKVRKQKQIDIDAHKAKLSLLKDEADEYGKSLKNSFKQGIEKGILEIKSKGGFGKALLGDIGTAVGKSLSSGIKAGTDSVNSAMKLFEGKASKINARLYGTGKTFTELNEVFESNLGASPYVKYADSIDNLATLVDYGVAYNIEQRAFLKTIESKRATTFDAFDSNLLKIIRIQQQDSTVYRMGAEAKLTEYFNKNFQDSSYMSTVYDSVSQAVADSVVQLGTQGGAEYEYNIQKWLGSLYSVGMSSSTLTSLATAINQLATGDIEGLQGSSMYNLLALSASRGGMSYGDLLSQGVNANNIDVLMSNIVSLWSEYANAGNQVTKKKYADLFGVDMADMVAIGNIKQSDIESLIKENFNYGDANKVLGEQLNLVGSRMHVSEMINNAFENVVAGIGTQIASSPGMASIWMINNMIKDATGGINIPFITAMGNGIGMETDLNSLVNLGIVGAGTLGQIGNVMSSLSNKGGLNLEAWGASDMTTRGTGTAGIVSGVKSTTSQTTYIGNASSSDIYDQSLNAAYDNVDKSVAGTAIDDADKMKKAIVEAIDPNIKAILELLKSVTTGQAIRVKVEDYGLTSPF